MDAKQISTEIMTDIERSKLEVLAKDKVMLEAAKKFILAVAYKHGVIERGSEHVPTRNWAMNLAWGATNQNGMPRTDEELGQNLRAMTYAVQLVGSGFQEIAELDVPEVEKSEDINETE